MTYGLLRIAGRELKKTLTALLLIGLIFISMFTTIDTLSTLAFSFRDSFFKSYGHTGFSLHSTGFDVLDEIDEIGESEYILKLDGAFGYTQCMHSETTENMIIPYFIDNSVVIDAFPEFYHFLFSDYTSVDVPLDELDEYINGLVERGISSESYEYRTTYSFGEFTFFNSSFTNLIFKQCIEYDDNIEDNSVFISNLIAQQNNIKLNDTIKMVTDGGEATVRISGIFDFRDYDSGFICNINLLKETISVPDEYSIDIDLIQNENFINYYDYFNSNLEEDEFTYDKSFLRLFDLVRTLDVVIIALLVAFITLGVVATYEFTKLIIDRRKKFIYHLKLIGARNTQIIFVYLLLFIPMLIVVSVSSYFISELFIGIVAVKCEELFDWTLISRLSFVAPIVLMLFIGFFFAFLFGRLLNKNKRMITYTLYKEAV